MKRVKVKKKLRKQKNISVFSCGLFILSILFVFLMFVIIFGSESHEFKIESRVAFVNDEKKKDTEQYETTGWIRVQGTNIDYPIINVLDQGYEFPVNDKSYAWLMNDVSKFTNKIDIGGHNILNLSVNPIKKDEDFKYFEELKNFVYPDFVEENQFIQLNIDGKDYLYQVFSVNFLNSYEIYYHLNEHDKSYVKEYLDVLKKSTLYDFDVEVNEDDDLISLYTCTRFYGITNDINFVVTGKLVDNDKNNDIKKFKTTNKYKEIVKIMEGGEADEYE